MAKMIDVRSDEPKSEQLFYTYVANNLPNDIICYHNREVNGMEFDFCLLIPNFGLVIVEVKGWRKHDIIKVVSPDEIHTTIYDQPQRSPKKQANGYRFNLLNMLKDKYGINPLILDMVCYPYMSATDYHQCGLDIVSEESTTLFCEDIEDSKRFGKKILGLLHTTRQTHFDKMNKQLFQIVRSHFENLEEKNDPEGFPYSRLSVFPSRITLTSVNNIVDSYFNGVKQIVFLKNYEDMLLLANSLSDRFQSEGIVFMGSNLTINSKGNQKVSICGSHFGIFLFDCFLVDDLEAYCNQELCIFNGIYDQYEVLLEKLSKKTGFNFHQYQIEHAPVDKNIVVKAGAGTGKTYSMISRIPFICHAASMSRVAIPADEIAMLTFTDEAADNMKTRLKSQFMSYFILTKNVKYLDRVANIERMRISTIHSFAKFIMQNTSLPLGVGADFTTVNGNYERNKIYRRILNEYLTKKSQKNASFLFNLPISPYDLQNFLMKFIDKMQNKGFDITNATDASWGNTNDNNAIIQELLLEVGKKAEIEYENFLIANNRVDLRKYIIYLNKCIADESFNKNIYTYKYVFIDEFQDVDDAQILAFLAMQEKLGFKFFIVGDLKQSIYRFRGATMDAFVKMGCTSNIWVEYTLNMNYRSDRRLLADLKPLFEEMGEKRILPYNSKQDLLLGIKENLDTQLPLVQKVLYQTTAKTESRNLYDVLFEEVLKRYEELQHLSKTKKLSEADKTIAILVRTNAQIADIFNAARKKGIIIESDSVENLYQLQSTLDLCKLTSALINPYNQLYLFDLLSSNNVNIQYPLEDLACGNEQERIKKIIGYLDDYFERVMKMKWADLIIQAQTMPILMVLRNIYEATMPWKTYSSDKEKQAYYRTNYEMIFEQFSKTNTRNYLTLDSVNQSLLIAISAKMEGNARRLIELQDRVKIVCTTVHKSKGLEYDSVYLPFTDDKIGEFKKNGIEVVWNGKELGYQVQLQSREEIQNEYFNSENELQEQIGEEARILYVALTRAINKIVWFEKESGCNMSWGTYLGGMPICQ